MAGQSLEIELVSTNKKPGIVGQNNLLFIQNMRVARKIGHTAKENNYLSSSK